MKQNEERTKQYKEIEKQSKENLQQRDKTIGKV